MACTDPVAKFVLLVFVLAKSVIQMLMAKTCNSNACFGDGLIYGIH